jgi:hypothetical protein
MPADEMEAGQGAAAGAGAAAGPTAVEGYDPSMPASDMNTGATSSLAYDPSMPAGDVPHGGGGYDPSMPAGAGEDEGGAAEPLVVDQEDVPIAPPPANAYDDPTAEAEPAVPTYDDAPLETLAESTELKIGLPEGLTDESLSVVANPQLVRQYRLGRSADTRQKLTPDPDPQVDPTAALGLFNWSVQKTEVVDARAWYEVIALRNPTAVSSDDEVLSNSSGSASPHPHQPRACAVQLP